MKKDTSVSRFWAKTNISLKKGECWNWTGCLDLRGYGVLNVKGKHFKAHRFSYLVNNGVLNANKHILHSCDNPACVNPEHLREGSDADNISDKVSRNRQSKGEDFPFSKMKNEKISEIRKLYNTGKYSQKEIGNLFGIDQSNVSYIINNKTWKHVNIS